MELLGILHVVELIPEISQDPQDAQEDSNDLPLTKPISSDDYTDLSPGVTLR